MAPPLLEVAGLNAFYGGAQALHDVTFSMDRESVAIVGRNGMGKTTLCNAIMGFEPPRTSGSVTFEGTELVGKPAYRIARGLMTNPDCLIMDEPSEGLAPIIIQGLWQAIAKLKAQGLSILLVEQNAALALQLVDQVHVISKGRVVYSGAPKTLWADDAVKSKYLGI